MGKVQIRHCKKKCVGLAYTEHNSALEILGGIAAEYSTVFDTGNCTLFAFGYFAGLASGYRIGISVRGPVASPVKLPMGNTVLFPISNTVLSPVAIPAIFSVPSDFLYVCQIIFFFFWQWRFL